MSKYQEDLQLEQYLLNKKKQMMVDIIKKSDPLKIGAWFLKESGISYNDGDKDFNLKIGKHLQKILYDFD